jgi:hypothetical protein
MIRFEPIFSGKTKTLFVQSETPIYIRKFAESLIPHGYYVHAINELEEVLDSEDNELLVLDHVDAVSDYARITAILEELSNEYNLVGQQVEENLPVLDEIIKRLIQSDDE